MDDPQKLQGKIAALGPSFTLMAELTNKPPSATVVGLYAAHFVELGLAMDDVNRAVEAIMTKWNRPYWPSADQIATEAKAIAASSGQQERFQHVRDTMESVFREIDEAKWERRCAMAETWSDANPARFQAVLGQVKADCVRIQHLAWQQESAVYRKAFRDGAIVQACNTQAGMDERKAARLAEAESHARAAQFAATTTVPEAA